MRGSENIVKIQYAKHDKLNEWQSFLVHLHFSKDFIFCMCHIADLLCTSHQLSWVVCQSARNSVSSRIWSTWVGPQSTVWGLTNPTEPAPISWTGPEWGVEPSLSWLWCSETQHSVLLLENMSLFLILNYISNVTSPSFLCLRSNKDVICRSGKETELWVETAEASCSFGADNNWYKYWS